MKGKSSPRRPSASKHRITQIHPGEDVRDTAGEGFSTFEVAAERRYCDVGEEGKRRGTPQELSVVPRSRPIDRSSGQAAAARAQSDGARAVSNHVADVAPERAVELAEIPGLEGSKLTIGVRMAADRALAEEHQRPGQDVGALDGDSDRKAHVVVRKKITRTARDTGTAENVHGIVDRLAVQLGEVVLGDRRDHRGLGAAIEASVGVPSRCLEQVCEASDPRQGLFDALELADRCAELLADRGVGAGDPGRQLDTRRRERGKRDAPSAGSG